MYSRRLACFCVVLVSLFATPSAHAIPLLNTLGGPAGFGANRLYLNDDASSCCADSGGYCGGPVAPIDLTAAFPAPGITFFGMNFTNFCVNNNGNIDFSPTGSGVATYTPQAFPVASERMIAPWWGDVDTRQGSLDDPDHDAVYWDVRAGQVAVTWHNVGFFDEHDGLQNDFQVLMRPLANCGAGGFIVEFRYNACEWTTGDASGGTNGLGGTPAQAGFDAGDLVHYYSLPGSLSAAILNVCTTSNGGIPGDWIFTVCGGVITGGCPGAGQPCMVPGLFGACAHGVQICDGMDSTVCVQTVFPTTDLCDGLDEACTATYDGDVAPRACYTGAAGTEGVGVCHGGTQTCNDGIAWGSCTGEVLPSPEICDDLDNDCNGVVDDLPPRPCYTGPAGTEGVGACHGGLQTCTAGVWGACVGEELPQPDTCNGIDSECLGRFHDAGLPDCIPPPEDASMPVDVVDVVDVVDISVPVDVVDASVPADVVEETAPSPDAACPGDPRCNPRLLIDGRAGPIGGCLCVAGPAPHARPSMSLAMIVAAFGFMASRRRRRS